ncbi:basic proline-rich protein-like [Cyprinodon tularosa]|uniref:basic proline-rich protein-like n=1 Tax=Cyprinodon tularosa TaxID=77115 RepID=UPI0018E2267E|nr:basic proline-rich protein-like [Cyprinodon tularosa]
MHTRVPPGSPRPSPRARPRPSDRMVASGATTRALSLAAPLPPPPASSPPSTTPCGRDEPPAPRPQAIPHAGDRTHPPRYSGFAPAHRRILIPKPTPGGAGPLSSPPPGQRGAALPPWRRQSPASCSAPPNPSAPSTCTPATPNITRTPRRTGRPRPATPRPRPRSAWLMRRGPTGARRPPASPPRGAPSRHDLPAPLYHRPSLQRPGGATQRTHPSLSGPSAPPPWPPSPAAPRPPKRRPGRAATRGAALPLPPPAAPARSPRLSPRTPIPGGPPTPWSPVQPPQGSRLPAPTGLPSTIAAPPLRAQTPPRAPSRLHPPSTRATPPPPPPFDPPHPRLPPRAPCRPTPPTPSPGPRNPRLAAPASAALPHASRSLITLRRAHTGPLAGGLGDPPPPHSADRPQPACPPSAVRQAEPNLAPPPSTPTAACENSTRAGAHPGTVHPGADDHRPGRRDPPRPRQQVTPISSAVRAPPRTGSVGHHPRRRPPLGPLACAPPRRPPRRTPAPTPPSPSQGAPRPLSRPRSTLLATTFPFRPNLACTPPPPSTSSPALPRCTSTSPSPDSAPPRLGPDLAHHPIPAPPRPPWLLSPLAGARPIPCYPPGRWIGAPPPPTPLLPNSGVPRPCPTSPAPHLPVAGCPPLRPTSFCPAPGLLGTMVGTAPPVQVAPAMALPANLPDIARYPGDPRCPPQDFQWPPSAPPPGAQRSRPARPAP